MNSKVKLFFTKQLNSYYPYFDEIAYFDFVPYGTTKRLPNGLGFKCDLGSIQCFANKIYVKII
jgi:hypothetical protein